MEKRRRLRSAKLLGWKTRDRWISNGRFHVPAVGRERGLCGTAEQDSHRHRVPVAHASGWRAVSLAGLRDLDREEQPVAHDRRHRRLIACRHFRLHSNTLLENLIIIIIFLFL